MLKFIAKAIFLMLFLSNCQNVFQKSVYKNGDYLFPIVRDNRWGFINQKGEEVIQPVFRDVGLFEDTLAPARLNGTWGFINQKGAFVISPKYDFVGNFSENLALVWQEGKPGFIDKKGIFQFYLPDSIEKISSFDNGIARFSVLKNGIVQHFLLNKNGEINIDLQLEYAEGLAVIKRDIPAKGNNDHFRTEYAIQDSTGKLLVPFGRYDNIDAYKNGFFEISIDGATADFDDYSIGFLKKSGELAFLLPKNSFVYNNYFSEGLIAVETKPDSLPKNVFSPGDNFIVWYDTLGKAVLKKFEDNTAMPFKNGRTFAGETRNWYLMDKKGNQVGNNRFEWVPDDGFKDNMAIVAKKSDENFDEYGIIDTNGVYIVQPKFNHVSRVGFQEEGLLVAINEPHRKAHESPTYEPVKKSWGLLDTKGRWIFEPKLTEISPNGYKNGLLYAEMDSLYGYINPKGHFVWKAIRTKNPTKLDRLNIDCMARGYYYAFENDTAKTELGGDFKRNRAFKNAHAKAFVQKELGVFVAENERTSFKLNYDGLKAYVFNRSNDTLRIPTQDNRLYIVMQAINTNGDWQNIEFCPSSWCGNSYYDVKLKPDEFWEFEIPVYDGDFSTSLRLAFTWSKNRKEAQQIPQTIYSNIFSGKINPAQFWRKQGYSPNGLMDPYFE